MPKIACLILDRFADWEIGPVLGIGAGFYGLEARMFTLGDAQSVRSMGGLNVVPDISELTVNPEDFDALVIPGGARWEAPDAPDAGRLIRSFRAAGKPVAAICGGTLALARSGALDGIRHTSNAADYLATHAPGYAGADHYEDTSVAVADRGIITAAGAAPVHFAAEVFRATGIAAAEIETFLEMAGREYRAR